MLYGRVNRMGRRGVHCRTTPNHFQRDAHIQGNWRGILTRLDKTTVSQDTQKAEQTEGRVTQTSIVCSNVPKNPKVR